MLDRPLFVRLLCPDAEVRIAMGHARDLNTENVPAIGVGFVYYVWGASTRLGNVPTEGTTSGVYRGWSRPVFHEQIYIKEYSVPVKTTHFYGRFL
jgi:hypothetical protein